MFLQIKDLAFQKMKSSNFHIQSVAIYCMTENMKKLHLKKSEVQAGRVAQALEHLPSKFKPSTVQK
jgi:hypothetical protein